MPIKKKRIKHSLSPKWLTTEIKEEMSIRDKFKKNKQFPEYKAQRNKVTQLVREAKEMSHVGSES